MIPPKLSLIGGTGGRFGRSHRFIAQDREVAILDRDLAAGDVLLDQVWFRLTGELSAEWSLIISPFDETDRGIRVAEETALDRLTQGGCGIGEDDLLTVVPRLVDEHEDQQGHQGHADRSSQYRELMAAARMLFRLLATDNSAPVSSFSASFLTHWTLSVGLTSYPYLRSIDHLVDQPLPMLLHEDCHGRLLGGRGRISQCDRIMTVIGGIIEDDAGCDATIRQ